MFDKDKRHITKGIVEELPMEVILFLYSEIDELLERNQKLDYLQVFDISVIDTDSGLIEIEHRQEIPLYKKNILIYNKEIKSDVKVFLIDEKLHSLMLLSSEY